MLKVVAGIGIVILIVIIVDFIGGLGGSPTNDSRSRGGHDF